MDLTLKHHLTQNDLLKGEVDERIQNVIYEVASQAHNHLLWARELKQHLPKQAIPAFLPSVGIKHSITHYCKAFYEDFLHRLQKENFDPFNEPLLHYGLKPRIVTVKNHFLSTF
jgi:phytoene/squalene synthetase